MAIKFRSNPAPLTGALLVSNPRRKKRRKTTRRRKNTAAGNRSNRKRRTSASRRRSSALKRSRRNRRNMMHKNRRNGLAIKNRRNRSNRSNRRNMMHKNRRNVMRKNRRNGLARKNRANRRNRKNVMRKNRRNGTKRGMRRKTARRAYVKRRRNSVSTYLSAMPKAVQPLHKALKSIPLVGQYGVPSLLGMAGAAPVALLAKHLKDMEYMAGKPVLQDLSFAIAGLLGAGLLSLGKKSAASQNMGFMLAVAGGSISAYKLLERYNPFGLFVSDASLLSDQAQAGLFMSPDYTYPTVPIDHPYNGVHFGDGGQWEVANFYSDADMSDAHLSGDDLSASEGQTALRGQGYWCQAFPHAAKRIYSSQAGYSSHAGKEGHRWGWLIKMIGFNRFQKLAKMNPADRMAMIRRLKKVAMESAQKQFDLESMRSSVPQISSNPLNGLGLDMSGLASDMAGIATVGASI